VSLDSHSSEPIAIGLYQLDNLIRNQVRFAFFDLRSDSERYPPSKYEAYFKTAHLVSERDLLTTVQGEVSDKNNAVLLFCQNGTRSRKLAIELEAQGYINVFILRGGVEGFDA
jgi:rhodanese-related sulfurtransferase